MDVYKIEKNITHTNLAPTEHIVVTDVLHAWPNNSESDWLGSYMIDGSGNKRLNPEADIAISNVSDAGATVTGYLYHINRDYTTNLPMDVWLPYDMTNLAGDLVYSLHTRNEALSVELINDNFEGSNLFPNPAQNNTTLRMVSASSYKGDVSILGIDGKVFLSQVLTINKGLNEIPLNISSLQNGVYMVKLSNEINCKVHKLIIAGQ